MKLFVRSLVIALAVTGAIATSFANATPAKAIAGSKIRAKISAMPIPSCAPGGEDGCGIYKKGK